MNNDVIDRALRWARDQGMNQSAFAARIGALPQHITNWKKRGVPTDQYQIIAETLGRSIDELVGRVPEKDRPKGGAPGASSRAWPFPKIDESKVYAMKGDDAVALERAFIVAAGNVGLDIKKS